MKDRGDMMGARLRQSHAPALEDYERECRKARVFFRHNYLRHLPEDRTAPILEIGCGLGQFLSFLKAEGYANASGIDASDENIDFCRSHNLEATQADASQFLEATDRRFATIIMNDVLEHVEKDKILPLLGQILERLSPGGVLLIKTINMANPILGAHSRYNDFTHEVGWTEESLREVLEQTGFDTVELCPSNLYVYYGNPLNYLALFVSKFLELFFLAYCRLNGRTTTRIFTKNLIAVARRMS